MNVDDAEILRYYDAESYKMRVWSEFLSSSAEKPQYKLQAGGDSGSDNLLDESSDALARDRRSAAGEEYDGDDDDDDDDHEASADRRANTMAYQVSVLSDNDPLNIKESIKRQASPLRNISLIQ
ncbi:hypothetical protein EV182_006965 [Spiromyces aspiralis]|uniref:Uncharacterized protein n=1 Tax=Spiromyces aspiralis TaxID=68401 RepID=A0ACC1HMR3_9FUNG|nr:hypothetical protein EV182_006965 [Spiromyces aspiralis]